MPEPGLRIQGAGRVSHQNSLDIASAACYRKKKFNPSTHFMQKQIAIINLIVLILVLIVGLISGDENQGLVMA